MEFIQIYNNATFHVALSRTLFLTLTNVTIKGVTGVGRAPPIEMLG